MVRLKISLVHGWFQPLHSFHFCNMVSCKVSSLEIPSDRPYYFHPIHIYWHCYNASFPTLVNRASERFNHPYFLRWGISYYVFHCTLLTNNWQRFDLNRTEQWLNGLNASIQLWNFVRPLVLLENPRVRFSLFWTIIGLIVCNLTNHKPQVKWSKWQSDICTNRIIPQSKIVN